MKAFMILILFFSLNANAVSVNNLLVKAASQMIASAVGVPGITVELVLDANTVFYSGFNDRVRAFQFFARDWSELSWHTEESESSIGKKVESVLVRIKMDDGPSIGFRLKRTTIVAEVGKHRSFEALALQDQMARSMLSRLPPPILYGISEDDSLTIDAWEKARQLLNDARFEKRYSFLEPFYPDFKDLKPDAWSGIKLSTHFEALRYYSKLQVDNNIQTRESAAKILASLNKVYIAARNITNRQTGWQFSLSRSTTGTSLNLRRGGILTNADAPKGFSQALASYLTLDENIYEQAKKNFDLVKILIENGSLLPKGKFLGVIPKPFSASHKGLQEQLFILIDGLRETYQISQAIQTQGGIDLKLSSNPQIFIEEVVSKSLDSSEYMHEVENKLKQYARVRISALTTIVTRQIEGSCIQLMTRQR